MKLFILLALTCFSSLFAECVDYKSVKYCEGERFLYKDNGFRVFDSGSITAIRDNKRVDLRIFEGTKNVHVKNLYLQDGCVKGICVGDEVDGKELAGFHWAKVVETGIVVGINPKNKKVVYKFESHSTRFGSSTDYVARNPKDLVLRSKSGRYIKENRSAEIYIP